ncbi:MAG: site-2 protease family protein [Oscillospiraceae bacterium]|nr:site-2 protease family protein [Oscillospiraceae bacterium]
MDLSNRFSVLQLLVHAIVLFTALPVHECSHALAAVKLGDPTPKNQGRLTLNPFAHLTLWGTVMMILAGFGWGKPVMVNPNNFKNPKRDNALVALAGPVSNLLMAYLSMVVYKIILYTVGSTSDTFYYVALVFYLATFINISLAVFNLLPIPPLDGGKIFGAVLPEKVYFGVMRYEQFIIIAVIVLLYTGLLDVPMSFLREGAFSVMSFLTGWVDIIFKTTVVAA